MNNERKQLEATAADMISQARSRLLMSKDPRGVFFASLAMRLEAKPSWSLPTMVTDGKHLFYNPGEIIKWSAPQVLGAIVHEVLHCAMKHHVRLGHRDQRVFNVACDLAINPIVTEAGFVLPGDIMTPDRFGFQFGLDAESYYDKLIELAEQKQREQNDAGDDAEGDDAEGDDAEGDDAEGDGAEGDGDAEGDGQPGSGGPGDVISPPQDEARKSELEWDAAVVEADHRSQQHGNLPGQLSRFAKSVAKPKLDWKAVLREFITKSARSDFSWSRPSRRSESMGFYMPSSRSDDLGNVAVLVDVSGSVNQAMLDSFAAELEDALSVYPCKATIIYHDHAVQRVDEWCREDGPLKLAACGGGGTSHCPAFAHIGTLEEQPDLILSLTDGYTQWPSDHPQQPTLFVMTTDIQAPFGQTVRV